MKPKTLIVTHGNDLELLNIVLNLVENYVKLGVKVEVLNMSTVVKIQDAFNRKILKFAHLESPETPVLNFIKESGVPVYQANDYVENVAPKLPLPEIQASIEESIRSTLISMFSVETPPLNRRYMKLKSFFQNEAERTFQAVLNVTSSHGPYREISVVNGRFPYQRSVMEAAKFTNSKALSFERGTYEHSLSRGLSTLDRYFNSTNFWHEEFPATNRLLRQKEILERSCDDSAITRNEKAQIWLNNRSKPNGSNQFNENWKTQFESNKKYVAIFSSSMDEFAELGMEWKEAKWETQWKAFTEIIPLVKQEGYEIILRIHPNLRNKHKSERAFVSSALEDLRLQFPYLKILHASSNIDSYSLVENASAVIVWNSTIGLESSLMGIPTACLSSCEYDLVADVERWLQIENVDMEELFNKSVDISGAATYISGMYMFDRQLLPLLSLTRLELSKYGRGLPLLANRWAFRGNNRPINLVSILLPKSFFFAIRKIVRKISVYRR